MSSLVANVNSFDDIGSGPLGAPPMRPSAYRRRRKTKRMRGSGKKRGRTKKCKCGPKCKSCGKYNCKKGRSCKCPPGCGSRRNSRRIRGGSELELLATAAEAKSGTVGMDGSKYTLKWPSCSEGTVVKWSFNGSLIVAKADADKGGSETYWYISLV